MLRRKSVHIQYSAKKYAGKNLFEKFFPRSSVLQQFRFDYGLRFGFEIAINPYWRGFHDEAARRFVQSVRQA